MKMNLLLCPVNDLAAAIAFYRDTLGWPVKFRDGDRYCAIDAGGLTLGLAAQEERIVEEPAPVLRVDDIEQNLAVMIAAGASIARPLEQGPHEVRAVLRAPGGGTLVLSASRPPGIGNPEKRANGSQPGLP
ncbi:VOC family protein [Nevskia soli]|uniref:VOC family protein n=1 Tax=Nevskia soli TaxID=418856 RepID=UPI0006919197|nr:VOC family protein [Nevskia soli]